MVAPVARKAAQNPGAVLLVAGIAALVLLRGVKALPEIPDIGGALDAVKKPADWVTDEWDRIWNPPSGQFSPSDPLAALRQEARTVKRYGQTSGAFLGGVVQTDDDYFLHDEEYYQTTHYDNGIPVAVPVEINRDARLFGERVRGWLNPFD